MNWFIILTGCLLSITIVSLLFGTSSYRSQPGKVGISVLKSNQKWSTLLLPEYDQKGIIFQSTHESVMELVERANNQFNKDQKREASKTLRQAIKSYENVRKEASSAVVELNLALMAEARVILESDESVRFLYFHQRYVKNALSRANKFLEEDEPRYEPRVKECYITLSEY